MQRPGLKRVSPLCKPYVNYNWNGPLASTEFRFSRPFAVFKARLGGQFAYKPLIGVREAEKPLPRPSQPIIAGKADFPNGTPWRRKALITLRGHLRSIFRRSKVGLALLRQCSKRSIGNDSG